jgi:hypothetical protein
MRCGLAVILTMASALAGGSSLRADGGEAALAVVEQALRAHGGEAALAKTRNLHRVGKGSLSVSGQQFPFSIETTMQLPDRMRDTTDLDVGGQKNRVLTVVNGEKVWQTLGADQKELDKERAGELRDEAFVLWLTTLVPLKDRSVTVTLLPPANVLGKPASALKVTAKGRPDVTLFFDKQSGLLIKIERPAKQAGIALKREYFLAEHKDFGGAKLPTRWLEVMNGTKAVDLTLTSYDFPSRIEDKVFDRP